MDKLEKIRCYAIRSASCRSWLNQARILLAAEPCVDRVASLLETAAPQRPAERTARCPFCKDELRQ